MNQISKKALHCPNCGASISEDCVCCDYCGTTLTVAACPSCFGAVFKGMKFCSSCGAALERNEVNRDKDEKILPCPRCEHTLSPVQVGTVYIHECTNCGGLWLSHDTFQRICDDKEQKEKVMIDSFTIPSLDNKPISQTKRMYVPCPECSGLMQRKNFASCSGVIVDWCQKHGTWFDYQELQQIINFIHSGALNKARQKELAKLQEEQRRIEKMKSDQKWSQLCTTNDRLYDNHDLVSSVLSTIFSKYF